MTERREDTTTLDGASLAKSRRAARGDETELALVVTWCGHDPRRVGEVLFVAEGTPCIFGRGGRRPDDVGERALLVRQRPGDTQWTEPLDDPFVSRTQMRLSAAGGRLEIHNQGRRPILRDGKAYGVVRLSPGETIELEGTLLLTCTRRPRALPRTRAPHPPHPFGEADAGGIVGESPAAWALRDDLGFAAARDAHVLLLGESGTGKELVAQAIHARSRRASRKLVARNAATIPAGLIDAELFGNVANYPQSGMIARAGLVGEADGSTLFLDEIGELPEALQTHLLRVLDAAGEYQRLGEAQRRTSNLRLIAATNRHVEALKHDLAARLELRLELPGLAERQEDIPLVMRHLLCRTAQRDPPLAARFFDESGEPRVDPALVGALLVHPYTTHVRELQGLLWRALMTSTSDTIELTPALANELKDAARSDARTPPTEVTAEVLADAMRRHGGVKDLVWRELGLANRYVLKRLLKKHGLAG